MITKQFSCDWCLADTEPTEGCTVICTRQRGDLHSPVSASVLIVAGQQDRTLQDRDTLHHLCSTCSKKVTEAARE